MKHKITVGIFGIITNEQGEVLLCRRNNYDLWNCQAVVLKKGIKQAKELAEKLDSHGIQIIFSSSRIRAKETSDILKHTLNCDVEVVEDIRERNSYGILTGTNKDEAKVKHPELVAQLKDYRNTIESAEDYDSFTERVRMGFEYISNSNYNTVAIVTHGGSIRCLFRSILKFGELTLMN